MHILFKHIEHKQAFAHFAVLNKIVFHKLSPNNNRTQIGVIRSPRGQSLKWILANCSLCVSHLTGPRYTF